MQGWGGGWGLVETCNWKMTSQCLLLFTPVTRRGKRTKVHEMKKKSAVMTSIQRLPLYYEIPSQ